MERSAVEPGEPYVAVRAAAITGGKALFARHVIVGVLSFAGVVVLLRAIGADAWAIYSIAYFLILFLDQLFVGTLLGALVRDPAPPTERDLETASASMNTLGLGLAALFAACSFPAASLYGDRRLAWALLAVGACAFVYAIRAPSLALLERHLNYRRVALAEVLDQVCFYAVAIPAVILDFGLDGVLLALVVRGIAPAILVRRTAPTPLIGRFHRPELRRLRGFAVPGLGTAGFVLLSGMVPVIVLGDAHSLELAFALTTVTIIGYAATFQVVAQRIAFPTLAALQGRGEEFRFALTRAIAVSDFLIVSLLVPLCALAPLWLPILFGDSWERAGLMMAVFGVGFLFNGAFTVAAAALNSLGHPRDVFVLNAASTSAYAIVAILLTPESTLLGVAAAFAITRTAGTALALTLLAVRAEALPWARETATLAVAGAAMVGLAAAAKSEGLVAAVPLVALAVPWFVWKRSELALARRSLVSR